MPLDDTAAHPAAQLNATASTLANIARADMERTFSEGRHRPSENQWAAIMDYLRTVEALASDRAITEADRVLYLSAIPPGTGKSVAVQAMARAIASSAAHDNVGVLIAVNRIAEAEEMARALQAQRDKLCVVSGRDSAPGLLMLCDHAEAGEAQLVITTQASLKETLRRSPDFDDAARYFYRGQRRKLVLWDESIAFNRPVVLDSDTAVSLAKAMRHQSPDAAYELKRWCGEVDRLPRGTHNVPDFRGLGVDFGQLEQDADEDTAAQARALSIISGEPAYVLASNSGSSLVTYVPELPRTLLPAVVTDASAARGVHHAAYDMMTQTLPIKRLAEAEKTYRHLTIRRVNTPASRSVYRNLKSTDGLELIEMIVRYIQQCAPHPVLVVSYKKNMTIKNVIERTIEKAITARLTQSERDRTHHLTWGHHTSTNAYTHIRHMIFAGLNFVPTATAYAASGAALGKSMKTDDEHDHPAPDQVREMEKGMLRDSTLQAVLRGAARIGVDGDCESQEVVIPARPQTGLTDADYEGMFPGCTVMQDLSLMPLPALPKNPQRIFDAIKARQDLGETEVEDTSIYKALNMPKAVYGRTKVKPVLLAWLSGHGWTSRRLAGGRTGFRRTPT